MTIKQKWRNIHPIPSSFFGMDIQADLRCLALPCLALPNNLPSKIHIRKFLHLALRSPNGIMAQQDSHGFFFIFPWFPMCSHYVPFECLLGSLYVPHIPNVFPNMFSIAPHFYPICFGKFCPPFTYIYRRANAKELYFSKQNFLYFGETPQFHFLIVMANQIGWLQK